MKKIFNKVFSKPILEPILTIVASILILEYIIFPCLTIDNTLLNIGAGILGIILGVLLLIYADTKISGTEKSKKVELSEEEQEKILNFLKDKGLYQEPKKENEDGKI